MKLSFFHKNENTSRRRKGNLNGTNRILPEQVMTKSSLYAKQIIINQAGTNKPGLI